MKKLFWLVCWIVGAGTASGQEQLVPLQWNASGTEAPSSRQHLQKTAANTLPFFEDFLGNELYPDAQRWVLNRQVYVNNTMGFNPVSQGVCTFDALGAGNRPYDTVTAFGLNYADSLTSISFDLLSYLPEDSIYLSFFYQPQGIGFSPETTDSLMLYFRTKNGLWVKQWSKEGTTLQPFRQVMIPVRDTNYLYAGFQFRFVNKASINLNDDVWNLDYIRMDAGRSAADTAINDVALSTIPGNLLRDYTSMPYWHYTANPTAETGTNLVGLVQNSKNQPVSATVSLQATDLRTGATVGSGSQSVNAGAYSNVSFQIPRYLAQPAASLYERVTFRQFFSVQTSVSQATTVNDTLSKNQVFDNYFAYDDGTAEKAYFLNLLSALPGKIAIEFHTNVADTLRGAAILFGNQVPTSAGKFFSMGIYRKLAGVNNATADELLYSQDFYQPRFVDSVNRFYYYTFAASYPVPAGTYYFSVSQPASSGSDSLYYAIDANRIGGNHLYFNVDGTWRNSTVSGALMVRPLFGAPVEATAVTVPEIQAADWTVYPNPGTNGFQLQGVPVASIIEIADLSGRVMVNTTYTGPPLAVTDLAPGWYLVRWKDTSGNWTTPKKWLLQTGL
ncbi:MAG: T9SS type A sorting domain-containing protein [Sphingobacteriales bacterium]|nr:MAG: T9SS type A sorting domain-containing protein [Sphingobacteriales bacterium]